MIQYATIALLAFTQNTAFSVVSRSRNRDNTAYHLVASFFSNCVWFMTFRYLVTRDMGFDLFPFYTAGTMLGSEYGRRIAIWVERKLDARTDPPERPRW